MVNQDEMAHYDYEPFHLDLQCLQIQLLLCLELYGLTNMNLNATKHPFGHLDISVGKQCKSRKIM